MPSTETLILKLARVAHEAWCERMFEEGWRPGTAFDPATRTHDAIVPFEQLSPVDRRAAYLGIATADIVREVEEACQYTRGADRELGVEDVRIGMRVLSCDTPPETGSIESWEEDSNFPGTLDSVRIRWDSGEVIDHAASEREFRPASGAES